GMVYLAGKPDHKMDNDQMIEHIVQLVQARADEIETEKANTAEPLRAAE
ncbi:MAG: 4-hydroxy-3-methylbut-2-en-1-yl diphosphate synthase, partial [Caulobacteraceae bacterium]|nr:4-hydroxy-3-methylbut-2-en-1-yl diphosphate synthase [Caulobacteraceae bacterium]MDR3513079.1 4-hydroxy-3-methylbut-2-en-1-yl diphosphate synthase [Caulobacteraceae bacterium]